MNLAAAYAGTVPAQVDCQAVVASAPHFFQGSRSHRTHEAFYARTGCGPVEVVDNVDIAPPCPVRTGDRIEICGEMVHDRGRPPVIHWTHHDPSGRHAGGFIRLNGRTYS
jgi:hypothetical protein